MAGTAVLQSIQACRIAGAAAIVAFHAMIATEANGIVSPPWVEAIVRQAPLAIDFFFVASGFIVYYVTEPKLGRPGTARRFFELRLSRVFITYLPVGVALALLYALLPGARGAEHEWTWFTTLTLLPSSGQAALIPAWTLQNELAFFLLLGAGIAIGRPLLVMAAWAVVVAILQLPSGPGEHPFFSFVNLDFATGVAVAVLVRRGSIVPPALPWIVAAAAAALHIAIGAPVHSPAAGLVFGALLYVMVRADIRRPLSLPAWLAVVAESTFAVYLLNNPLASVLIRVVPQFGGDWAAVQLAALSLSFALGVAYHLAYERHAMAWARGRLKRHPSTASAKSGVALSAE